MTDQTLEEYWYVRPGRGGIFDYSEGLVTRAAAIGVTLIPVNYRQRPLAGLHGLWRGYQLSRHGQRPVIAELGSNDIELAWTLVMLAVTNSHFLVTIHDTGTIVRTFFPFGQLTTAPKPFSSVTNRLGRLLQRLLGKSLQRLIVIRATTLITLVPDQTVLGRSAEYIPHSLFLQQPSSYSAPAKLKIGYFGFWGKDKGLELLIDAYAQARLPSATLVLAGSTGDPQDEYSQSVQQRAKQHGIVAEFPGFIADNQTYPFLSSFSVLVLPYLSTLPGAMSGVALRAVESGVPIIAARTPALTRQLGSGAAYFEPGNVKELAQSLSDFAANPQTLISAAQQNQSKLLQTNSNAIIEARFGDIIKRSFHEARS